MYQFLLIRRYLFSKLMPLLAALSLALCTALVLITWSVMGGFLRTLLDTGRAYAGDVTITWPSGIAHYEDLMDRLKRDPTVAAVSPTISTFAILRMPDDQVIGVSVIGVHGPTYRQVVEYDRALWWRPLEQPLHKDANRQDPRLENKDHWAAALEDGRTLTRPDPLTGAPVPAAVVGIEMSGLTKSTDGGFYEYNPLVKPNADGTMRSILPPLTGNLVTLNLVPLDSMGRAQTAVSATMPVANEVRTGVFELDRKTVMVNFDHLQRLMRMDGAPAVVKKSSPYEGLGSNGGALPVIETAGAVPARATGVIVKAVPGVTPDQLRVACSRVYEQFAAKWPDVPKHSTMVGNKLIRTWEMAQSVFAAAVERETALVLGIFWFITLVCSVLILAIFWAMISEKTRDIGILRTVGASRSGIAGMWIGYGALLGFVGAMIGLVLALFFVWYINEIHEFLLGLLKTPLWDRQQHQFDAIPNKVNPWHAAIVVSATLFFAILGAIIPAVRAAMLRPVSALRFE